MGGAYTLVQMKLSGQSEERIGRFVHTIAAVAFGQRS